jgi:hypothetical protein
MWLRRTPDVEILVLRQAQDEDFCNASFGLILSLSKDEAALLA